MSARTIPIAIERRRGRDRRTSPSDRPKPRVRFDGLCTGSDYSPQELDFLKAVQAFKRDRQCPKPSWADVVTILRHQGYRLTPPADSHEKEVLRFSEAIKRYMREHRSKFPAHTEVLAVAKSIGYLRTAPSQDF